MQDRDSHLAEWQSRLQDCIDNTLDSDNLASVRAHLNACSPCRDEHAKLVALDAYLQGRLVAPKLGANFADGVFARVAADENTRKELAKLRAEQAFRKRVAAFAPDWRDLGRRHVGSLIAAAAALVGVLTAGSSMWESLRESVVDNLSVAFAGASLPTAATVVVASIAALAIWWMRTKLR